MSRVLIVVIGETQHGVSGIARAFCERDLRVPADRLQLMVGGEEGRKEGHDIFVTSSWC